MLSMLKSRKKSSVLLFLLGLGSATKIFLIGAVSISELVIFFIAPFLFLKRFEGMKRDGFLTFIYMLVLMIGGMFVSSYVNKTAYPFIIKQFAVFYGFFAYYIMFYTLLRGNFKGIGWFFLGCFISGIITIWGFNPTVEVGSSGFSFIANAEAENVIAGPLFWIGKVRGLGQLPIIAEYLKTPLAYSIITPIIFVVFAMFNSVSGRAQSMCVLVGGAMMLIGKKSRSSMKGIGRHFGLFIVFGAITLLGYKATYSYAARNGYLGQHAQNKYLHQTQQGTGALSILMAGRGEFFVALFAIKDKPIFGFGPAAEDKWGYYENFLTRYGAYEDMVMYNLFASHFYHLQGRLLPIPAHSYIMCAWMYCGLPGLIFFVWFLYAIFKHIRMHIYAVPQWYGYYALTIPSMVWSIFFNPFGDRFGIPLLMVCMCFSNAVSTGKLCLPYDLEMEARKYE